MNTGFVVLASIALLMPGNSVQSAGVSLGMVGAASRMAPQLDKKIKAIMSIASVIFPIEGAGELHVIQATAMTLSDFTPYVAEVDIQVTNKVGVEINSINVVYVDADGNPIPVLGGAAGKNIGINAWIAPQSGKVVRVNIFDPQVAAAIAVDLSLNYIGCHLEVRGLDSNGNDVVATAQCVIRTL